MDRLPLPVKIAVGLFVLAMAVTAITLAILAFIGVLSDTASLALFSVFAILGGIGFISDAFKRGDAIPGFVTVVFRLTSMGLNIGLIAGDWAEWWWQGLLAGLAAGIVVALIEGRLRKGGIRPFRLVFWNLAGLLAIGEGISVLLRL